MLLITFPRSPFKNHLNMAKESTRTNQSVWKTRLRYLAQAVVLLALAWVARLSAHSAPVQLFEQAPLSITNLAPGVILVDFGRVAFGNLQLIPPPNATGLITVHFGEAFSDGRINRQPPGSVRYAQVITNLAGSKPLVIAPPASLRNTTNSEAVQIPPEWGVVLPFRWVEIEGWSGELRPEQLRRRAAFARTWDDQAASFHSSDETLDRIWELCRYSIKATTFAGIYVDGERERIAYEADAYLNQLSQYYTDRDGQMARDTFDRLMAHPTWPTEWAAHMIFIAHADWMRTGDTNWLASRYSSLKTKLLNDHARADGLIVSTPAQIKRGDLVDWPAGERDGFVFTPVNTVINAFHLRSLNLMAELARVLHREADAADYIARERVARKAFQDKLFDSARGIYRDGEGTDHASLHANLFPLAFGLVPEAKRTRVAQWLADRGMACSVYAAQYLMEGLFENDCATQALALMTASHDRSWKHMVESGTTISWEAWDQRFKPNQDWNHAWGAAPANLLPRYVLGVQPLAPGWSHALIRPHPGSLQHAEGKIPTPLGPVLVRWEKSGTFKLTVTLPPGMSAQVEIPAGDNSRVFVDGKPARAQRRGAWWILDQKVTGTALIETKTPTSGLK